MATHSRFGRIINGKIKNILPDYEYMKKANEILNMGLTENQISEYIEQSKKDTIENIIIAMKDNCLFCGHKLTRNRTKTDKAARASRENGKKGGRPKITK